MQLITLKVTYFSYHSKKEGESATDIEWYSIYKPKNITNQ